MTYKKEQRFEIRYEVPTSEGNRSEKVVRPRSEEAKDRNLQKIKELGYRLVSCKKLYPFSTEKNQHNFMLVANICKNTMYDMMSGEIPYNNDEYIRLDELHDKADKYFCYPLPVAWVPWEDLKEMKELATMAVNHRMDACERAGRYDLLKYC